jgi:hypothetical protein
MKFFLFRREAVNAFSERKSNTGDGISVFGVPAESIANMTASEGEVTLLFNDAGVYDNFNGRNQEGMEKVRVTVSCTVGEEFGMIRDIMEFIAADSNKNIMVIDVVAGFSSFKQSQVGSRADVLAVIPSQPVIAATGEVSNDPASTDITSTATNTIAGVSFPSATTRPIVDYNETTLTSVVGQPVGSSHTWENAGTGGSTYDINNDTGTPTHSRGGNNRLATAAVTIAAADLLHLAAELTVEKDYTMYMAYNTAAVVEMYSIYSDAAGRTKGFGNATTEDRVYFRYDGNTGEPAFGDTNTTDYNTTAARIQDPRLDDVTTNNVTYIGAQMCYILVIRRDEDFNIYVHNHTGDVIAYIPAVVGGEPSRDYRTDGDLVIDRLGGDASGGAPSDTWKGELARFGVIDSDIGNAEAARIARELFDRYNYYPF